MTIDELMKLADQMADAVCVAYSYAEKCREQNAWVSFIDLQNVEQQVNLKRQALKSALTHAIGNLDD